MKCPNCNSTNVEYEDDTNVYHCLDCDTSGDCDSCWGVEDPTSDLKTEDVKF
jgi:hypothetical protein